MRGSILGARIRERRRHLGITQAELARRVGISASYLNLIEHNKRAIAGALLRTTAHALDLELEDLDGAAERRLLTMLEELGNTPTLAALGVEVQNTGELIGRFPGWAAAVAALAKAERDARDTARALADRLTHDPFLGNNVHRMLTQVAAIRSAAEILVEHPDIGDADRRRFHQMVHDQSHVLTEVGEALAAYFDKADESERVLTPTDEVETWFEVRDNRFDELEAAALSLTRELEPQASAQSRHQRAFEMAESRIGPRIDRIIAAQTHVHTARARAQARDALLAYTAGALLVPMQTFEPLAQTLRFDIEALADAFSVDVDIVCQRLTAMPAGEGLPRFGYFCANAAGTVTQMRSLPGLSVPRYASACPLWVLYRAQQTPQTVLRQRVGFPSGARYVFVARARSTGATGFGKPRHYLTDMLTMSEADAALTAYAPDEAVPVEPVGGACRSCARHACEHRVADPLTG